MIQDIRQAVQRLWRQLTWTQRISLILLTGGVVAVVTLVAMWANAPTYGVLFANLSDQDAGAIMTQLTQGKIPYQLANGGATILVPQSMVDRERLQLASQNLPSGDVVGFESFDQANVFQMDSTTEQIKYTRALEGELTRTISQLSGVAYTRVNIVVPQESLFSQDQASPTASVLLKLVPGATLSADQIAGVQHLVASAVQGLKPDEVTVVDGSGTILSSNSALSGATTTGLTVLEAEARYASNLEAQLTAMLDTVLGPDKAVVRVNDTMGFTQTELTSNTYDAQSPGTAVNEEHVVTNTSVGPASSVGGVPGLASNVPTYGTSITNTAGIKQTQQSADITFAHSNTVAHVTQAPGAVQRLAVAVLLDNVVTPTVRQQIQQAVAAAAGLDPRRGDQLSVTSIPFNTTAATQDAAAAAAAAQQAFILSIVRWAALIVVPLILLFLLRRMFRAAQQEEDDDLPIVEEVAEETPLLVSPVGKLTIEEQQRQLVHKSMTDLAREKPDVVAGVIGRWIEEDAG